jgi:hypothetical protein
MKGRFANAVKLGENPPWVNDHEGKPQFKLLAVSLSCKESSVTYFLNCNRRLMSIVLLCIVLLQLLHQ